MVWLSDFLIIALSVSLSTLYAGPASKRDGNTVELASQNLLSFFSAALQALLFYVPRWLWKNWEAGKIHALMMDLDIGVVQDVEKRQKKRLLLDYLADNLKHHNWWAYRYFFCEFLALVNIIGE